MTSESLWRSPFVPYLYMHAHPLLFNQTYSFYSPLSLTRKKHKGLSSSPSLDKP